MLRVSSISTLVDCSCNYCGISCKEHLIYRLQNVTICDLICNKAKHFWQNICDLIHEKGPLLKHLKNSFVYTQLLCMYNYSC